MSFVHIYWTRGFFLFILANSLYIVAILPLHISRHFTLSTKFRILENFWVLTSVPSQELSWVVLGSPLSFGCPTPRSGQKPESGGLPVGVSLLILCQAQSAFPDVMVPPRDLAH